MSEMTIERAIKMLEEEYERAKKMDFVKRPLAYALYQVWKKVELAKEERHDRT
jgi:hypothetical protein